MQISLHVYACHFKYSKSLFLLLFHCPCLSVVYSRVLNTSRLPRIPACFVALLSSLEFHTFPSACQVPFANPILLSISLSDPSCVLIFPPRYTKFFVCSNSCHSTSRRNFLFSSPRNWHSVFCMLMQNTIYWLKIPERIEYKVISLTYMYNTLQFSQSSYRRQLHVGLHVHDPDISFNAFLFQSNIAPPFCHLITKICQSLHSHNCPLFGTNCRQYCEI